MATYVKALSQVFVVMVAIGMGAIDFPVKAEAGWNYTTVAT